MKIIKVLNKAYFNAGIAISGFMAATPVLAEVTDLGSMGDRAGQQSGAVESGFVQTAGLVGLVIFAIAGAKLFTNRNQQEGKGKMIGALFAGIFLMGIYFFAAVTSNTITDQGQSADDIKAIIKGGNQG